MALLISFTMGVTLAIMCYGPKVQLHCDAFSKNKHNRAIKLLMICNPFGSLFFLSFFLYMFLDNYAGMKLYEIVKPRKFDNSSIWSGR